MRHSQSGNVALQVGLSLVAVLGFAAIGIDLTVLRVYQQQLHNAAEASAHAGAAQLDGTSAGMTAARQAAVALAAQNPVVGGTVVLELNESNAADGDIVLGRLNSSYAFEPTTNAALATAVKTKAFRGGFGTYFAGIFGLDTVSAEQSSIAVAGGPRAADCPIPIAIPSCYLPPAGVCGLEIRMSSAGVDNAAWALPGSANPSASSLNDALNNCTASSDTMDLLSLNNGQITSVLSNLANKAANSADMWPTEDLGTIPARQGNGIPAAKYGHVLKGLGMVYDDPSNCTDSQFNYDGVPILGYVSLVVYDVQTSGNPKWVKLQVECTEVDQLSGGGFYGTTAPPRIVVE